MLKGGENGGELIVKALTKSCEDLGVKLLCETAPKRILTGAGGRVTGVLAATKGGEEFTVTAKSVIIATGGWEKVHLDWLVGPMTVALGGGHIAGENAARYSLGRVG